MSEELDVESPLEELAFTVQNRVISYVKEAPLGEILSMVFGFRAAYKVGIIEGIIGALSGSLAYRLATSTGQAASVAGIAMLSALGLINVVDVTGVIGKFTKPLEAQPLETQVAWHRQRYEMLKSSYLAQKQFSIVLGQPSPVILDEMLKELTWLKLLKVITPAEQADLEKFDKEQREAERRTG